jgi:small ubiquitin-related modifier
MCCCVQVRFVYDGNRLNPASTPSEMEMEEGDTIDAFLEQIGGCSSICC